MKRLCAAALFGLWALDFAAAQNLIPDPTFSSGVSAWGVRDAASSTLNWNSGAGADGAPGFARLAPFLGLVTSFATICLPVEAGVTYSWGGYLRIQSRDATTYFSLTFYPDSSCGGFGLLHITSPPLTGSGANLGTWYLRQGPDVVAPPTAASVLFEATSISALNAPITLDFDNVFFGRQGTGPPTQLISVPTLSGTAIFLFALFLAAAGAWRVTDR
jgi:hypothetical protein